MWSTAIRLMLSKDVFIFNQVVLASQVITERNVGRNYFFLAIDAR